MTKKKPIDRGLTREQVERSLQLKEAHLARLQASTIPLEALRRFEGAIEIDRARLAQLQGGGSHDKRTA